MEAIMAVSSLSLSSLSNGGLMTADSLSQKQVDMLCRNYHRTTHMVCSSTRTSTFEVHALKVGGYIVSCTREEYTYWCPNKDAAIRLWCEYASDDDKFMDVSAYKEVLFWADTLIALGGKVQTHEYIALHRQPQF